MSLQVKVDAFKNGLLELKAMTLATEQEVLNDTVTSAIITNNVNFFTKSFLISACAHLEICIKDIVFEVAKNIDSRLALASIPSSIIDWRYGNKRKSDQSNGVGGVYTIGMTKKEIDDLVSGNVFKTREALAIVGIEIASDKASWESWKELIQVIVTRRNNIVHHNDDASDLSFGDIRVYIESMLSYIDFIISECSNQLQK